MDQNNDDLCPACSDIDYRERMCEPCRLKCRIFDLVEYNKGLEDDNEVLKIEIEKTFREWEVLKVSQQQDSLTIRDLRWCLEQQRTEISDLQLKLNRARINSSNNSGVIDPVKYDSDIEIIKNFGQSTAQFIQAIVSQPPQPYSRGTHIIPKVQSIKDKDLEDALDMYNKRSERQRHAALDMDNTSYDDIDDIIANMK